MKPERRLSVGVLGAGLIGVDLAMKVERSAALALHLVAGRTAESPGLKRAARLGLPVTSRGLSALADLDEPLDVVFDATDAGSHAEHAEALTPLGTLLVDLTPSRIGRMVVPTVNGADVTGHRDLNMVSCGGQASVPIVRAVARAHHIDYVEVVATAATLSVGHGTRLNLDEYVETTQDALREFTGVGDVKAILNISPARPPATFRVAISLIGRGLTADSVRPLVAEAAADVRAFATGYTVTGCVVEDDSRAFVAVEVTSVGDQIPAYAGNLDIINSAAIRVAERCAVQRRPSEVMEVAS
ncbi:acetaldehyde dehydrogenase (acetylating) [Micromonospora sp. HUAS LYJ1]|uniref:acetaldehyde dehydrogenase (acetylating) n=1 Tax=Micromonospora sp. HUAS LYJ1 TaxID=3061626 RepID=UPI0026723E17|nr:acetaldehyde dehydrogenase (acetylating) [Micromonospora sp. HUAS LYJ1]WKU02968.1 acetaldehyde dehydrogenase (acetylating) [Micromonospora sp. HUAS LYJ1]